MKWAAAQRWSTGKVGMLGKSYDAWTGLMGVAQRPPGLEAVVAHGARLRRLQLPLQPGRPVHELRADARPVPGDRRDPGRRSTTPRSTSANGAPQAWCYGLNQSLQQIDSPHDPFWQERNLLPPSRRSRVPLFLTQGFLETNTKQDAALPVLQRPGVAGQPRLVRPVRPRPRLGEDRRRRTHADGPAGPGVHRAGPRLLCPSPEGARRGAPGDPGAGQLRALPPRGRLAARRLDHPVEPAEARHVRRRRRQPGHGRAGRHRAGGVVGLAATPPPGLVGRGAPAAGPGRDDRAAHQPGRPGLRHRPGRARPGWSAGGPTCSVGRGSSSPRSGSTARTGCCAAGTGSAYFSPAPTARGGCTLRPWTPCGSSRPPSGCPSSAATGRDSLPATPPRAWRSTSGRRPR